MERLQVLIGVENELPYVAGLLRRFAQMLHPPAVGAYQVACSEETEWECIATFQRTFADELLPSLKPGFRSAFRSVSLGGRYEWGAIRVAEQHFALPRSSDTFKLIVVKLNSHVGVLAAPEGIVYGSVHGRPSDLACCGALSAMLDGGQLPALQQLRDLFRSGGRNRLLPLLDPQAIAPRYRLLAAAVVNARLQAQQIARDIEQYRPETPTVYLVVPCVTINRPDPDTELVVGQYGIDWTERAPNIKYDGLGDDPSQYAIAVELGRARLTDAQWPRRVPAPAG
jgi:hypothetical protein